MPNLRLTKRLIDTLPHPSAGQILYRDTALPGFGLRVGRQSKTYFVEGQVNRRTRRVTIGRADVFAPEIARKKAMAILSDMAEGRDPNEEKRVQFTQNITLEKAFELFFATRTHLSAHTVSGYGRTARLYLKAWAKTPMSEITRQMVLRKHQHVAAKSGKITANNVMRHLRSVYNFVAATQEQFPANPVLILTQARAWNKETRRRTVIASHQLPAWWCAVLQEPDYSRDFLLSALFTGMRRGELMQLRWDSVDLAGRSLHSPTTKNGDPLDLPLSEFMTMLLTTRKGITGLSPWVFPGPGKSGHIVETKKFQLRIGEASGVHFTLHDLRRTFITIAESLDVPYYALKRMLNHRTGSDVTGGYIVIDAERLRGPVDLVARKILELVGEDQP
jgi:integrase